MVVVVPVADAAVDDAAVEAAPELETASPIENEPDVAKTEVMFEMSTATMV